MFSQELHTVQLYCNNQFTREVITSSSTSSSSSSSSSSPSPSSSSSSPWQCQFYTRWRSFKKWGHISRSEAPSIIPTPCLSIHCPTRFSRFDDQQMWKKFLRIIITMKIWIFLVLIPCLLGASQHICFSSSPSWQICQTRALLCFKVDPYIRGVCVCTV